MFTGIIAAIGRITTVTPLGAAEAGLRLTIDADALNLADVALGDSIAINGACMTAVGVDVARNTVAVDVSRESFNKTVGLTQAGHVNLEKAMRLSDRLGGHLVSGHVDDVALIHSFESVGESFELIVKADKQWQRFIADKGSITLNGTSLTSNRVWSDDAHVYASINLIPHTICNTVFQYLTAGDSVNLEIDLLARYVAQLLHRSE